MTAQNGIAYGEPAITDPLERVAKNPRVLKAHLDMAEAAIPDATAALKLGTRHFAAVMAEAVVGAEDWTTTRYVVGVRTPAGAVAIFGPYATPEAATKAATSDAVSALAPADPSTGQATVRVGVWPLLAAPKAPRRKALKAKKKDDPNQEESQP